LRRSDGQVAGHRFNSPTLWVVFVAGRRKQPWVAGLLPWC
jgi:hypothetical protein